MNYFPCTPSLEKIKERDSLFVGYSRLLVSEMSRRRTLPVLPLPRLFVFCVIIFQSNVSTSIEVKEGTTDFMEKSDIEGCIECGDYRYRIIN